MIWRKNHEEEVRVDSNEIVWSNREKQEYTRKS